MINEAKAIEIINKHLKRAQQSGIHQYFPIAASQIYGDKQLCEDIIDFLGDVYIYDGLDVNYEENVCDSEMQDAIHFLAFCNGKV